MSLLFSELELDGNQTDVRKYKYKQQVNDNLLSIFLSKSFRKRHRAPKIRNATRFKLITIER